MQESITAAMSVVRRRARSLGIAKFYERTISTFTCPEGAAQGWSVGRYWHCHRHHLVADRHSGARADGR